MGAFGTRDRRFVAAGWVLLAACVGASFALASSAASRAYEATKRAFAACAPGHQRLTLDDEAGYAALAERFESLARDEARDVNTRLGAAEVAWAANALGRANLIGDGFERAFDELLTFCDSFPDEPAFLGLAVTALRDHRSAVVPSDTVQNRADEALLDALAQVHANLDPDDGTVPLVLAAAAFDAGRTTEAADLLTRAACAVVIDEHPLRRMLAAERVLVEAGVDDLEARDFLVRRAFQRPGTRPGEFTRSFAERFALAAPSASTTADLRRVAERVAATTLLRSDARVAAEVTYAAPVPNRPDAQRRGDSTVAGADQPPGLGRGDAARPVRALHDLVFLCAAGFALLAFALRSRRQAPPPPAKNTRRSRSVPVLASVLALAAPMATLLFLGVTRTWPFDRGEDFLDVLGAPHPALLALPLASLPFVFGGGVGGTAGGVLAGARRMLWMLAIVYALAFAWTSAAVDHVEALRARALNDQLQFDPATASAD